MMRYLLDTNVLLWHATADQRLPEKYRSLLASYFDTFYVSIASLWEITIKVSRGNLELVGNIEEFIQCRVVDTGFHILPIRTEHLTTLRRLPFHHKDPFDRLIISQGLSEQLPILYTDKAFEAYFAGHDA